MEKRDEIRRSSNQIEEELTRIKVWRWRLSGGDWGRYQVKEIDLGVSHECQSAGLWSMSTSESRDYKWWVWNVECASSVEAFRFTEHRISESLGKFGRTSTTKERRPSVKKSLLRVAGEEVCRFPRPVRSIWTVLEYDLISVFTSLVETSQIRTVWVSRNHATTMSWDHEEEVELIAIKKRTRRWSKSITRTIGALAEERARRVSLGEEPPADGVNSQKSCLSANVRSDAAKHVRPRSVLRRSVWPPSKSAALTRRGSSLNTQRCWGKGSNGTQDGCGECQRWANSYSNFHLINVSCRRSTCWPPWTCSRSRTLE